MKTDENVEKLYISKKMCILLYNRERVQYDA